jgi:hypothetical protein
LKLNWDNIEPRIINPEDNSLIVDLAPVIDGKNLMLIRSQQSTSSTIKKSNYKQIFCYVLKYKCNLRTRNVKALTTLSSTERRNAMEGLATLSKYTGCYGIRKDIREKYQLRWSNSEQDDLKFFTTYMSSKGNLDEMVK